MRGLFVVLLIAACSSGGGRADGGGGSGGIDAAGGSGGAGGAGGSPDGGPLGCPTRDGGGALRPIDLLFLIDDSSSMTQVQQNLAANFPVLLNTLTSTLGQLP